MFFFYETSKGSLSYCSKGSSVLFICCCFQLSKTNQGPHEGPFLELNIQLDKTLDDYPVSQGFFKLPEAAAEEFVETAMTMAQLTKTVSQACKASGINAFSVTAKTHDLVHIAMLSKFIHPALTWCFGGEDYMRIVQRLIQSCLSGNNFWRSPIKATSHYRLAMHLKFSDCNP